MSEIEPPTPFPLNPIFNVNDWVQNNTMLTISQANKLYLRKSGDTAYGLINFSGGLTCSGTCQIASNVLISGTGNYIQFPNGTQQQSAYTGGTAGTYTSANITIDSNGKISSISSGSGGITFTTLTSTASSVNSWTFDASPLNSLTGENFQFWLYTSSGLNDYPVSNYTPATTITTSGTPLGLIASGLIAKSIVNVSRAEAITYCAGYQQKYTWSVSKPIYWAGIGYQWTTFLESSQYLSAVSENSGTCPPSAGTGGNPFITFSVKANYANLSTSQNLIMKVFSIG